MSLPPVVLSLSKDEGGNPACHAAAPGEDGAGACPAIAGTAKADASYIKGLRHYGVALCSSI